MKKALLFGLFCLAMITIPHFLGADLPGFAETGGKVKNIMNPPQSAEELDAQTFLTFRYQLRIIGFLTVISMVPFAVMMLTSFTRISIIFHFLRQGLGYQQVPSNQIIIGLSLILTAFVMHPIITEIQDTAILPYMNQEFQQDQKVSAGLSTPENMLLQKIWTPLRTFLLRHTREEDLSLFLDIGEVKLPYQQPLSQGMTEEQVIRLQVDAIPWYCIIPSFVMSELRVAFMMGFLLFLPFLIIDMVVASILMSMGMMMLPPVIVSTPFKLLLFILIDGWRLIIQQLIHGF